MHNKFIERKRKSIVNFVIKGKKASMNSQKQISNILCDIIDTHRYKETGNLDIYLARALE